MLIITKTNKIILKMKESYLNLKKEQITIIKIFRIKKLNYFKAKLNNHKKIQNSIDIFIINL